MSDLPAPLVPADVDIAGLDGFMLDVQRLFASELWALSTGDEFKAALALWGRAWQQSPAGSLPNDERILAAFSGAGKDWKKVREMALRGFVECSDGRLYHKVLCQDVLSANRKRQAFRDRTKAATEARRNRNDQRNDVRDDTRDDQRNVVEDANVTSVQGQGQGQKKEDSCPKRVRTQHGYPPDFLEFWAAYPTDPNMGKREALTEWQKLGDEERRQAIASCPSFVQHCKADPTYRPIHAGRYLAKRRFEGHAAAQTATDRDGQRIDFGGGVSWPEASVRNQLAHWRRDPSTWPTDRLGPPPGAPGCKLPDHLQKEAA